MCPPLCSCRRALLRLITKQQIFLARRHSVGSSIWVTIRLKPRSKLLFSVFYTIWALVYLPISHEPVQFSVIKLWFLDSLDSLLWSREKNSDLIELTNKSRPAVCWESLRWHLSRGLQWFLHLFVLWRLFDFHCSSCWCHWGKWVTILIKRLKVGHLQKRQIRMNLLHWEVSIGWG